MSKQISLTVPDEVMRRAEVLAGDSGRAVAEVLTDAIEASLAPLGFTASASDAISEMSDVQVLELADSTMAPADDRRLSELLTHKNDGGVLTMAERDELASLIQVYQEGLLRKAQATGEAVRHGLRPSPAP